MLRAYPLGLLCTKSAVRDATDQLPPGTKLKERVFFLLQPWLTKVNGSKSLEVEVFVLCFSLLFLLCQDVFKLFLEQKIGPAHVGSGTLTWPRWVAVFAHPTVGSFFCFPLYKQSFLG